MREKKPLLLSSDFGKDEDSVLALIKKLEHFGRDLANYKAVIEKLQSLSSKLTSRGHFDAENVNSKMVRNHVKFFDLIIEGIHLFFLFKCLTCYLL